MTAVQFLIQSLQAAFPNEMYNMRDSNPELFNEKVEDAEDVFANQIKVSYLDGVTGGIHGTHTAPSNYYTQTYK